MQPNKLLKFIILVLLLSALTIFSGCGGTAPPINHYGTARGFVKDAITITGIEEANVTIDGKSNITDSNGAYLIENIPIGSQSIMVTALGYQDYNNGVIIEEGDNVINDVLLELGATHYEDTSNSDGIATFTLQDSRVVQTKVIDVVTGEPIPNIDSYMVTDGTDVAFLFIDPAGIYIPRIAPEEQSLQALARSPEERVVGTIKELWKVGEALFSGYQPKYADQIENRFARYIFRTFFIFCFPSTLGDLETSLWEFLGESGLDLGVEVAITAVIPGANLALLVVAGVEFGNTMAYELWVEHYTSRGYSLEQKFEVWRGNPLFFVVPTLVPFVFPIEEPSNSVVEETTGSISGKVLDARTSLGIHNAQVEIVDLDLSTTTSSDGSYSFSGIPPGTYGIVAYKIGYNPSAQVNVRVFSGQETAALSIVLSSIVVFNHAPVITSNPITSATVNQLYSYDVDATDPEDDSLTYSLTTKPNGMSINSSTGLVTWTPSTTGDYDVTVKVSDGELFDYQSFTITVQSENIIPPFISWITESPMLTPRSWAPSVQYGGKIYVVGGCSSSTPAQFYNAVATLEVYDPATDTWEKLAPMSMPRVGPAVASLNGKIYVFGGFNKDTWSANDSMEVYHIATNTWTTGASMPTPRSWMKAVVLDNKIYVIGGVGYGYTRDVEVYDPATATWEIKSSILPRERYLHAVVVYNGIIYVIGGDSWEYGYDEVWNDIQEYDPITDTWEKKSSMPAPASGLDAVAINGKIYVFGGNGLARQYDIATDTWQELISDQDNVGSFSVCLYNNEVYRFGGGGWGPTSNIVESADLR